MASLTESPARLKAWAAPYVGTLRAWPWLATVKTLWERFGEDRLGVTASSLTFTTLLSLVPLVTVMLAVFSAFPMFAALESTLENFLLRNLVPDSIVRPVREAIRDFADKAGGLGSLGFAGFLVSALVLVSTIDRTLNDLWRVRQARPLGRRVLMYWAVLTLGPVALAGSLSLTTLVLTAWRPWASALPGGLSLLVNFVQLVLLGLAMTALFLYVPHTTVRKPHALAGGFFVAITFEAAKRGLALYLQRVPTYDNIYGAFATVPILMLWIYLAWTIVLLGAVIAAYAPSLQMRVVRRPNLPGWRFDMALGVLRQLQLARGGRSHGLAMPTLARALRVDPLQLEPVLEQLCEIDWIARLDERVSRETEAAAGGKALARESGRYVLLCDPAVTGLEPLMTRTLLEPGPASAAFVAAGGLPSMTLAQALGTGEAGGPAALARDVTVDGRPRLPG